MFVYIYITRSSIIVVYIGFDGHIYFIHCPFRSIFFLVCLFVCLLVCVCVDAYVFVGAYVYTHTLCIRLSIHRTFSRHYIARIFFSLSFSPPIATTAGAAAFELEKQMAFYSLVLFSLLFRFTFHHSASLLAFSYFSEFLPLLFICLHLLSYLFRMRCGSLFRNR